MMQYYLFCFTIYCISCIIYTSYKFTADDMEQTADSREVVLKVSLLSRNWGNGNATVIVKR